MNPPRNRLIGDMPKIGIRPTIDGRRQGVRESLEEQTMAMARSAASFLAQNLRHANGMPVECVIADTCIGGVAEALPFKECEFGLALMVTTICFLDNTETALKEAYRVLRPNGSLIIGLIDKNSPLGKTYLKHKNESAFYRVATFYSVSEVVHYLMKTGFRDFAFSQTIFTPLKEITAIEPVKQGYGEGSFVVIRARK